MNPLPFSPATRSTLLSTLILAFGCLSLTGCQLSRFFRPNPPDDPPPVIVPADPNAFPWETQVLEATGTSAPPAGPAAIPQRSFAAKQSAKTAALYQLREMIEALPIHEEATVGTAMEALLSVRHGIDLALRRAEVVEERPLPDGGYEVRVQQPLAPIAEILRQSYITPHDPLPVSPASDENRLGPLT